MNKILPISAVLPTRNRSQVFNKMLTSLGQQYLQPFELIVVDASTNEETHQLCSTNILGLLTKIIYRKATEVGAATQRNQAIAYASQNTIWFLEDDIILEPDCLERLWSALQSDPSLGGVNAMITNQKYVSPGKISLLFFQFLNNSREETYAGKCIGPAFNIWPEDRPDLPEVVPVDWLNTGCTLYRREALPNPLFPPIFRGYSLQEDVALSLIVGKKWNLANARTARIFHDSQPGDHKNNALALAKMELVNRHYIMTRILGRQNFGDYLKLIIQQLFGIFTSLVSLKAWLNLPSVILGKVEAVFVIILRNSFKK